MESDSTIPWVVLAISGTGFVLISFVESSLASVRRDRAQWLVAHGVPGAIVLEGLHSTPLGPTGSLMILKYVLLGTIGSKWLKKQAERYTKASNKLNQLCIKLENY